MSKEPKTNNRDFILIASCIACMPKVPNRKRRLVNYAKNVRAAGLNPHARNMVKLVRKAKHPVLVVRATLNGLRDPFI